MRERMVDVGGDGLAYRVSDGGGRPVVLVHGNSSSSRTWQTLMDGPFGARYQCFAPDLPGHGRSKPPTAGAACYSVPGHATALAGFVEAVGIRDAVVVGWSLGGNIAIEAAPAMAGIAAGHVVFGAPPVSDTASFARAFLPDPVVGLGFQGTLDRADAEAYAAGFLAPDSRIPLEPMVEDVLATDATARSALGATIGEGRFEDEVALLREFTGPIAILHGTKDRFVNLDYLHDLTLPTLWRGAVQCVQGAGHALQLDAPDALAGLLEAFVADLPGGP